MSKPVSTRVVLGGVLVSNLPVPLIKYNVSKYRVDALAWKDVEICTVIAHVLRLIRRTCPKFVGPETFQYVTPVLLIPMLTE